jgi:hypothetical protein
MSRERTNMPVFPGLAIGMPMTISFEGMGTFKSMLIGLEYGQYFIMKLPHMPSLPLKLYQQNYFVVRYFHAGNAYGFRTTLISQIKEPVRLFILDYPGEIESLNLRKSERYSCQLPACASIISADAEPSKRNGFITDISSDGCCFECDVSEDEKPADAKIGAAIELDFRFNHEDVSCVLKTEIRVLKVDMKKIMFGLKYNPDPGIESHQTAIHAIHSFIDNLKN